MTEEIAVDQAPEEAIPAPSYVQLTQARVPLRKAADALSTPDEQGRYPIVVIVQPGSRFRLELIAIALIVAGGALGLNLSPLGVVAGLAIAAAIVLAGSQRAMFATVPEGARAVLTQAGRVRGVAGPGVRRMNPTVLVSHIVAVREVPFWAAARSIATADDIRIDVQILVTFRIEDPVRFVFNTTAPDFDLVCQGASQTALRLAARRVESARVLDLASGESDELRESIGRALEPYGVAVTGVLVVRVDPPAGFLSTLEATKLAVLQVSEQTQQYELDRRVQTDKEALALQKMQQRLQRDTEEAALAARVRRTEVELEAEREALRLARLEERLAAYPNAARWDRASQKLEVARALAGNSRAMVQLGGDGDVSDVMLKRTLFESHETEPLDILSTAPVTPPKPATSHAGAARGGDAETVPAANGERAG